MPKAKFTKQFDYQKKLGDPMTSYPKGFEGDLPDSHYDAAVEAGAVEGDKPKPSGGAAAGTTGGQSK
jgi:hypothetical protein